MKYLKKLTVFLLALSLVLGLLPALGPAANAAGVTVEIGPCEGSYAGKPVSRKLSLVLGGASRCPQATLNGRTLECQYNADTREACVFLPPTPASQPQKVVVRW